MKNMAKCIICKQDIPTERKRKDTCSDACAFKKMFAWEAYLHAHKDELMKKAVLEFGSG